jgi:hypothetical protein
MCLVRAISIRDRVIKVSFGVLKLDTLQGQRLSLSLTANDFLHSRIFLLWRRRRHVPPKHRYIQNPDGVTSQKVTFFIMSPSFASAHRRTTCSLPSRSLYSCLFLLHLIETGIVYCNFTVASNPHCTFGLRRTPLVHSVHYVQLGVQWYT